MFTAVIDLLTKTSLTWFYTAVIDLANRDVADIVIHGRD